MGALACLLWPALFAATLVILRAYRRVAVLERRIEELRAAAAAREKAEAASRAKSRFLAVVSHEIRTPLNGVLGLAQLLGMTRLDAEQASYVEAIGESGRALGELLGDILDLSKIEAGKLELRCERFLLAPLVESVVELLAPRAQAKALEIACFISTDAPREVLGDPARLRQVLINLLGNAVNYTDRGGVGVRLLREGDALRIDVCDTGPGVAESAREGIFEDFAQADPLGARGQGGAGLGLAISRRLMGVMGGSLVLSETSRAGSVFSLTMPAPQPPGSSPPRPLDGQRVLIVSESLFEAPYLAQTLEGEGASARVSGAAEALARLSDRALDAVIVDCALGADDVAAVARSARDAGVPNLLLLFSPLERRAFGESALRDFHGWLVKPVRRASLTARLARARIATTAPRLSPSQSLLGLNVLVAEDNDVNALVLTRGLAKLGATAVRVRGGAEALDFAFRAMDGRAELFDVIIVDLYMPELDGMSLARRVREQEFRTGASPTPIVMLTATAKDEEPEAARRAGIDAYLTKPVDFATLAMTVEELRLSPLRKALVSRPLAQAPAGAMVPNLPDR